MTSGGEQIWSCRREHDVIQTQSLVRFWCALCTEGPFEVHANTGKTVNPPFFPHHKNTPSIPIPPSPHHYSWHSGSQGTHPHLHLLLPQPHFQMENCLSPARSSSPPPGQFSKFRSPPPHSFRSLTLFALTLLSHYNWPNPIHTSHMVSYQMQKEKRTGDRIGRRRIF